MWHCGLLNDDISKYSYIELAEWIIKCRQFVSKSAFDSIEDYQNNVHAFCSEWEAHYKENEQIYKSYKYKKAILLIGRKEKFKFLVDYGGHTEDITETYANMHSSIFKQEIEKVAFSTLNEDVLECDEKLKTCFSDKDKFKNRLNDLITDFYFNKNNLETRVFKNDKWFKTATYKDFLKECENSNNYDIKTYNKKYYSSYIQALESYGIPKTTYLDYMSIDKTEKALDKKFFINIAFVLSLPYQYAKKLLFINGYSIVGSIKTFDIICEKAFRIGFGRDYVIALIDKYNTDMKRQFRSFVEVQNITKTMRAKK